MHVSPSANCNPRGRNYPLRYISTIPCIPWMETAIGINGDERRRSIFILSFAVILAVRNARHMRCLRKRWYSPIVVASRAAVLKAERSKLFPKRDVVRMYRYNHPEIDCIPTKFHIELNYGSRFGALPKCNPSS